MTVSFPIKFMDIMVGVILGLGFQWWPNFHESWQYIAFVFAYLNLIDYWIDYTPTFKRFPLRNDLDIIVHALTLFSMFFLIYSPSLTMSYFLTSYILYRVGDLVLIWRIFCEHTVSTRDRQFTSMWVISDVVELFLAAVLIGVMYWWGMSPLAALLVFATGRIVMRVISSKQYHSVFYSS